MRWPKDQSWRWRWSRRSFRHSVLLLRAARAPAVHRPASERRPGPRDLGYEAADGPSSPRQQRILLQPEAPKRFRYRQEMRFRMLGFTRGSRAPKCWGAGPAGFNFPHQISFDEPQRSASVQTIKWRERRRSGQVPPADAPPFAWVLVIRPLPPHFVHGAG